MSVRRPSPSGDAPPLLALSQAPRRLDEVLRASKERGVLATAAATTDESGLTRALKKVSLAPTGTCLPRTFDPDYCAYDRYYAIGVSLVSAALGALVNTKTVRGFQSGITLALTEALGRQCHVPEEKSAAAYYGLTEADPMTKPFDKMTLEEKGQAHKSFSLVCNELSHALHRLNMDSDTPLMVTMILSDTAGLTDQRTDWAKYDSVADVIEANVPPAIRPLATVASQIAGLILTPSFVAAQFAEHMGDGGATTARRRAWQKAMGKYKTSEQMRNSPEWKANEERDRTYERKRGEDLHTTMYSVWALSAAWILKYVTRFMNQHALMIASFFRVNSNPLHNSEPLELNLAKFVEMCKTDIADGPNPPPEPPTTEELAEAKAAAEAQRQRSADVIDDVMKMETIMASMEKPAFD